jgi:KTSC domain
MDRLPVESTSLASVGYDPISSTLEVEFRNGRIYQYFEVPQHIYDGLMSAPRQGPYFNQYIRNSYSYSQIG